MFGTYTKHQNLFVSEWWLIVMDGGNNGNEPHKLLQLADFDKNICQLLSITIKTYIIQKQND
jgi:hypothetical protein